jgi:DNA-binding CsgD family transcriptional regulator/PAS domain-containing protein
MNARRLDELLLNLYACPTERHRWPEVLDRVCRETHARSAVIQILVSGAERARSVWTLRDSNSELARVDHEHYMADDVNPRMEVRRFLKPLPAHYALRDRDLFADGDPAYAELKDRLAAIQLGTFMSVGAPLPTGERVVLVLHRDVADRREFDADEETFARTLTPHLQQVFRICGQLRRVESHAHDLKIAIDNVRCGLVLCEADGRVCWANEAARHLFAKREVVWACAERLTTSSTTDTVALRRAIAEAARDDGSVGQSQERVLVLGRDSATEPLHLMIQPVSAHNTGDPQGLNMSPRPRVLVMLSSPSAAPSLPAGLIASLFALSPTESRLAAALCRGQTVDDYARNAGVTIGTARFQLKQVLAKVQVTRQSDLVRKVCSSVIAHALPRVK